MGRLRYHQPFHEAGARVQGHMFEVMLYGAYPGVLMRCLLDVTRACGSLSLSLLWPSLWFTAPLLAGVVVVSGAYSHQPVQVGQSVLISLEHAGPDADWQLRPSPAFEVEIGGFHHPTRPVRLWRIKPKESGELSLLFERGDLTATKSLSAGEGSLLLNPARYPVGWSWLLSPLESPLPAGLNSISVEYPSRTLSWKGLSAPWWLLLLLAFLAWSWLLALLPVRRSHQAQAQGIRST